MSDSAEPSSVDSIDLSALSRCGQCGYSLRGLPETGRCPECGTEYLPGQMLLFGWACGNLANVANSSAMTALWLLSPLSLYAVLWLQLSGIPELRLILMLPPVLLLLPLAVLAYRLRGHGSAPVQLRLSPAGFAQRDGLGPVAWEAWNPSYRVVVCRLRGRRYRISIEGPDSYEPRIHMTFVDFAFDAEPDMAEHVRKLIEHWGEGRA